MTTIEYDKEFSITETPDKSENALDDGTSIYDISTYTGAGEIYPSKMKREAILGTKQAGQIVPADSQTKIVKTLSEVRSELGYNTTDGKFDEKKYPMTCSVSKDKLTYFGEDATVVNEDGEIIKSCILKGAINGTVKIKPVTETWIVIENGTSLGGSIVVDHSAAGSVKFFLEGSFDLNNGVVRTDNVVDDAVITEDSKDINIFWYGSDKSKIKMTNNCLLCGAFRTPYTLMDAAIGEGPIKVSYKGKDQKPVIIGNALFKDAKFKNNTTIINTDAGGNNSNDTIKTGVGYFEKSYYTEY